MDNLKIGFVRRGYSDSGGAEAYLKRLAAGVAAVGHETLLITTEEWPEAEWSGGSIIRVPGKTPMQFADGVERTRAGLSSHVIVSLERLWRCDFFRAGDGVHRAWLRRRAEFESLLGKFGTALNRKHSGVLRLERALLLERGAGRVIANSRLVMEEIREVYDYPAERIDLVYNGVPVEMFRSSEEQRKQARASLELGPEDVAVLFVGSGWERKGLRFAIQATDRCKDPRLHLFVAGRGNATRYRYSGTRFLGVSADLAALYAAGDIFLLPTIYDPFSNACLEATASGIPVITTKANGFSEIMSDNVHGSVIDRPDNVDAICAALNYWSAAGVREAARPRILDLAARYDISVNVARTLELLARPR